MSNFKKINLLDNKEQASESSFTFDYEENQGGDFIDSLIEEKLAYTISTRGQGDIYKILEDSFSNENDTLEIYGYNILQDRLSLEDFILKKESTVVKQDSENIKVDFYTDRNKYSIILKESLSEISNAPEDIIRNILITNGGEGGNI